MSPLRMYVQWGWVLWPADGRIYANGHCGEYLMKHYTIILSVIVN